MNINNVYMELAQLKEENEKQKKMIITLEKELDLKSKEEELFKCKLELIQLKYNQSVKKCKKFRKKNNQLEIEILQKMKLNKPHDIINKKEESKQELLKDTNIEISHDQNDIEIINEIDPSAFVYSLGEEWSELSQQTDCNKVAPSSSNLSAHKTPVHLKSRNSLSSSDKLHKCQRCPRKFLTWAEMTMHTKYFHKNQMKTRFNNKSRAQSKKSIKSKCEFCNKTYNQYYLKVHIKLVHEKLRPSHKCEICNKRFTQKSHLNQHIKTVHEKQRPHKCDECNKRFGLKSNLKKHLDNVHG